MADSIPSHYMEFLRCALCSHDFEYKNPLYHPITLPKSGLTMCRQCVGIIRDETKCPHDHGLVEINYTTIDQLPINYPLLFILYDQSELPGNHRVRHGHCQFYITLDQETKQSFKSTEDCFVQISNVIKTIIHDKERQSIFNHSMIQKIFSLLNSQYINNESGLKILKATRSLAEDLCMDLFLRQKNPQQTTPDSFSSLMEELMRLIWKYRIKNEIISNLENLYKVLSSVDDVENNMNKNEYGWPKIEQALNSMIQLLEYFISSVQATPSHPH